MAISKELLEILVCPICKATVELKPDGSGLKCVQCHRLYPNRHDSPGMLIDEARTEEQATAGHEYCSRISASRWTRRRCSTALGQRLHSHHTGACHAEP